MTVCGIVIHGKDAARSAPVPPSKPLDEQPRIFCQTFMLTPDTEALPADAAQASVKYYVNTDDMRFVG